MRAPAGLGESGRKLWRAMHETFDFDEEPHKVQILRQTCRVADVIAELDDAADEAPLTVKGSQGQQVISPFIAEARAQRSLMAQLLARLALPDTDEAIAEKAESLSRIRAKSRRGGK